MDEEKEDQCELVTTADHQSPGPSLATVRKMRQRARVAALEETAEASRKAFFLCWQYFIVLTRCVMHTLRTLRIIILTPSLRLRSKG